MCFELTILIFLQTQCDDCDINSPISPTTEPPTMISPPENTVAIMVDISKHGGRIKFFTEAKFVGDVGAEDYKSLVMVPWDSQWKFYSIGYNTF